MISPVEISVVVPLYDEAENVVPLNRELEASLGALGRSYEVLFVDDGSRDETVAKLAPIAAADPHVRLIRLARNYGQTAAVQAGFDHARGQVIVTMDGDRQNDPRDIGKLLRCLDEGYDIVSGWRKDRQDKLWSRKLPSWAANRLISLITGVKIHDNGCAIKAYRREIIERTALYSDMHRFILVIMALSGGRYREIVVNHRPRVAGRSKYGISRTWKVLLDLIMLTMITRFTTRPGRWFGLMSLPALAAALIALVASGYQYLHAGTLTGFPIVAPGAAVLFAFASMHLILMAVIGELVVWAGDYREGDTVLAHLDGEARASR